MSDDVLPLLIRDARDPAPRRPRALLLTYACSPDHGSEPGVGWNRAIEAARTCDTWAVCEEGRYGPPIRAYLDRHGPIPGLTFIFVAKPAWLARCSFLPGAGHLSYHLWQRRVYRVAKKLHDEVGFDLVHQVTFCGYREPSYLWRLGVPFIWGPVGGTQNYPWRFLGLAGFKGAIREATRSVLNWLQLRFSLQVRRAAKSAAVVLAANTTVQGDFARALGIVPQVQLETGIRSINHAPRTSTNGPLRILWSGDLQCWKALPLLLRALAALPKQTEYEVRILGRGPLERSLQRLARRLGVDQRLSWMGWLPFRDALDQYAWANVLAFTSLRDTSGNVVLEALANGLPIVCLDHQGVHDMVTPECGIKVPVTRPRKVILGLSSALQQLSDDPALRARLADGALERAEEYLWERQGERMTEVYAQVLSAVRVLATQTPLLQAPVLQARDQ
jgi:glycosyltransferase involved in cell wall biosynthesis